MLHRSHQQPAHAIHPSSGIHKGRRSALQWRQILILALVALVAAGSIAERKIAAADEQLTVHTYVPIAIAEIPTVFGLNVSRLTPERGLDDIVALGTTWVRGNSLLWRDVEPVEGRAYKWDAPNVQTLEQEMINASQRKLNLIVIVRGSPHWATKPYSVDCAPINPGKYARFAAFMAAAVERYSKPPYNVEFWEIGNEPDAYIFSYDSEYGCWGIPNDPYYGGRAYGALLNAVYPAMKAAAPEINILNGGLLLDHPYDPTSSNGHVARFLEGVFVAGASASFDILSFHSYSYYNGTVDGTRGPTDWKVGYLRQLMLTYNVAQKPMIDTEAALLCPTLTIECRLAQADALGRYYVRAIDDGLLGHMWYIYDSDAFNNTALVEPTNISVQRTAFLAYKHASALLGGARLLGPLTGQVAGVEGYRFIKGARMITAFWSDTSKLATIPTQPGTTATCTDRDGEPIMCDNIDGQVTLFTQSGPTYVVEQ
jgi:hypothetical protein